MYWLPSSHLPHLPSSLTDFQSSLNLLCHSKTHARFKQDGRKAVWSIPYVSGAVFPSLKQNSIAYRSSKVSDCISEIHQLWQSGFSRVYSNCCCRCSFEPEIIKIGLSSHTEFSRAYDDFKCLNKKCLDIYWMHNVNINIFKRNCVHFYTHRSFQFKINNLILLYSFICTQLNGLKYSYVIQIIQADKVSSIVV